ncbi:MAG TPA: VTT domain-containing protein, partial [Gemmatimonadales bacterium]|nr:VTT domain-containing protein [Gemmatimonadales bacterium]
MLRQFIDLFLHLDRHLTDLVAQYGAWAYGILFGIIFAETGFVVTPFLPGDSLLFAAGAIAALGNFDPWLLGLLLIAAAFLGNVVNYSVGRWVGRRAFTGEVRWLRKDYLDRAHAFVEKHGVVAIIITRFAPILRTFAPFVAGVTGMGYRRFLAFNAIGAALWVGLFVGAGYFFGNLPQVKHNFSLVILGIIVV